MNAKLIQKQEEQDKYLTEMKELPPTYAAEKKEDVPEKKVEEEKPSISKPDHETPSPEKREKPAADPPVVDKRAPDGEKTVSAGDETGKRKLPLTYKDIILGIVNLVCIIVFVIIIVNFPQRSKELKDLKVKEIRNESIVSMETSDIEAARPKIEAINKFFLDESGVVGFVNDVELQETEGEASIKVTFASQKAVADRTGNFGIPVVIELRGSWEAIDNGLQKIDKLPHLVRPANVSISLDKEDPGIVVYKYGVILYVRESLGKTR